MPYLFQTDSG